MSAARDQLHTSAAYQAMELIDSVKTKLTDGEYLGICNALRKMNDASVTNVWLLTLLTLQIRLDENEEYVISMEPRMRLYQLTHLTAQRLESEIEDCGAAEFCPEDAVDHPYVDDQDEVIVWSSKVHRPLIRKSGNVWVTRMQEP